jgi:hypothetical protein
MTPPKTTKYNSVGITYDGKFFRSLAECERYKVLQARQREGIIAGLTCQPRFAIRHPDTNERICSYVGDFEYFRASDWDIVVEDVKGVITPMYKLKKRMMLMFLNIHITEVKARKRVSGIAWVVDGVLEGVVE